MVAKLLTSTGATLREQEILHELVVQTVLLYGVKIWVVMVEMLKVLEGLHHRLVRRIVGKKY